MKDLTKQVIILNNFYSPYIREAILILHDGAAPERTQIIDDAERIINDYLRKQNPSMRVRRRWINAVCIAAVLLGIGLLATSYFLL